MNRRGNKITTAILSQIILEPSPYLQLSLGPYHFPGIGPIEDWKGHLPAIHKLRDLWWSLISFTAFQNRQL